MKLLTPESLIEYVPVEPGAICKAEEILAPVRPGNCRKDWLSYGVTEGFYQTTQINVDGKPTAIIYFHISPDGGFIVNAAASIDRESRIAEVLTKAVEMLAKQSGCSYCQFETLRQGMVSLGGLLGWKPSAVVMRKTL